MENQEGNQDNKSNVAKDIAIATGVGASAGIGSVGIVSATVTGLGFSAGGIAAGSTAAGMMSGAAIANGGAIAAGSTIATLQSIGAVGLGAACLPALLIGSAVGSAGFGIYKLVQHLKKRND